MKHSLLHKVEKLSLLTALTNRGKICRKFLNRLMNDKDLKVYSNQDSYVFVEKTNLTTFKKKDIL